MTYTLTPAIINLMTPQQRREFGIEPGSSPQISDNSKPRKYRNQPTLVDGLRFDSGKEAAHYNELALLLKAGEIIALACHVRLLVSPEGCDPIYYLPDFVYLDKTLKVHVEDVKPFDKKTGKFLTTRDYKLKKKLFEAKYGIEIEEV